jgi:hypothetical protein
VEAAGIEPASQRKSLGTFDFDAIPINDLASFEKPLLLSSSN